MADSPSDGVCAAESVDAALVVSLHSMRMHAPMLAAAPTLTRQRCSACHRAVFLYCCYCCVPAHDVALLPALRLPVHIVLLHHPSELLSKATGCHIATMCPQQVSMVHWPPPETLAFPQDGSMVSSFISDLCMLCVFVVLSVSMGSVVRAERR